jgi:ribosomal protein L22
MPEYASAKIFSSRISFKHAQEICKKISGKKLVAAKKFLQNLQDKKTSIDGKYFTSATRAVAQALESAEANAKQKNLSTERLFVKIAKADKGMTYFRPRSRFKLRGKKAKMTNLQIVLEER